MTFKEIKKRSVYKTWQHKNRKTGLVSHVHYTPRSKINNDDFFHFEISCSQKYCGEENCDRLNCNKKLKYSSLDHNYKFSNIDDCKTAAILWHKRKI